MHVNIIVISIGTEIGDFEARMTLNGVMAVMLVFSERELMFMFAI